MRSDPFRPILVCFFLSGFAGLVFETLWTREFALVFGTSELAVATVLAAYMGGLAAGAAVARRWVLRTTRPLLVYAVLELGIGLGALAVPSAIGVVQSLAALLFGGHATPPDASAGLYPLFTLLGSAAILLVPTGFMGATLPLLTRFAVRREEEIGERVALLYAVNTAGAVFGAVLAAFWLLPLLGLRTSVWVGVAVNAFVFCLAWLTGSRSEPPAAVESEAPDATTPTRDGWILPLMLLAGVTSFTYEVLWTRLLGQILGGTVYAFGTMLASFLVGIAAGSAVASRLARSRDQALAAFPLSQLGVATFSLLAFAAVDRLPELALAWGAGSGAGLLPNAGLAGLVLLPGALFIGASFPLAVRILARGDVDASPASARVYAWNTVGAIAGSIGAGFLWIPLLGFHGALAAAVALNLGITFASAWRVGARARPAIAGAVVGVLALLVVRPGPPWRLLTTSPLAVVAGEVDTTPEEQIVFFAAGRSSTVMVREGPDGTLQLLTNGLPEANVRPPGATLMDNAATWLSSLPLLARPDTRSLLVIGLGAGSAIERIPPTVESIDVIELEEEVVEANRRLAERREVDPLADPRVRVVVNDARGALQLTTRRWDVIVSQPSHPWTAGASHLYTREFFEQAQEHLVPGGVLTQWLAPSFMDEGLLRSVVATLRSVFRHVELYWLVREAAVFFLAADAPISMAEGTARGLARNPDSFSHVGVHAPEDALALLLLDDAGTRALAEGAPLTTDAHNLFQFRAPRALRAPLTPQALAGLAAATDPLLPPDADRNAVRLVRRLLANGQEPRAQRVGESVAGSPAGDAVNGLLALRAGQRVEAVSALRRAVGRDPELREAWVALTRQQTKDGEVSYSPSAGSVSSYPELAVVADAWRLARTGSWARLAALESELASVAQGDPLQADALRLRALWRVESGSTERAGDAVTLLDVLLPMSHQLRDAILRIRALQAAERTDHALTNLRAIARALDLSKPASARTLDELERALSEVPADASPLQRAEVADALAALRLELGTGGRPQY